MKGSLLEKKMNQSSQQDKPRPDRKIGNNRQVNPMEQIIKLKESKDIDIGG